MSSLQICTTLIGVVVFCVILGINQPGGLSSRGEWWYGLILTCIGFWSLVACLVVALA